MATSIEDVEGGSVSGEDTLKRTDSTENMPSHKLGMLAQLKLYPDSRMGQTAKKADEVKGLPRKKTPNVLKMSNAKTIQYYRRISIACGIGIIVSFLMIAVGIVLVVKLLLFNGWIIIGVGIMGSAVLSVTVYCLKIKDDTHQAIKSKISPSGRSMYYRDLSEFPVDPVLLRGITTLVYHGHQDCSLCRKLRQAEFAYSLIADESCPHPEHCDFYSSCSDEPCSSESKRDDTSFMSSRVGKQDENVKKGIWKHKFSSSESLESIDLIKHDLGSKVVIFNNDGSEEETTFIVNVKDKSNQNLSENQNCRSAIDNIINNNGCKKKSMKRHT